MTHSALYWLLNPLSTSSLMCLLLRSKGELQRHERKFETALLITEGCLDADLNLTDRGRDALLFHYGADHPLLTHLHEAAS